MEGNIGFYKVLSEFENGLFVGEEEEEGKKQKKKKKQKNTEISARRKERTKIKQTKT